MIDLRLLRGESTDAVDALLRADEERRSATQRFESLRAEQKSLSKRVPKATGEERTDLLLRTKELAA